MNKESVFAASGNILLAVTNSTYIPNYAENTP